MRGQDKYFLRIETFAENSRACASVYRMDSAKLLRESGGGRAIIRRAKALNYVHALITR